MVAKKKPIVKLSIEDQVDGPHSWEGTSCIVAVIDRTDQTRDALSLHAGLMGKASDADLLVMLRFLLDKMQDLIEDKDIAAIDLLEHNLLIHEAKEYDYNSALINNLCKAYIESGKREKAKALIEKYIIRYPKDENLLRIRIQLGLH